MSSIPHLSSRYVTSPPSCPFCSIIPPPPLLHKWQPLSPGDESYPHCHSVIAGRKSWKTLEGKTEAVWPPYLEVVLFEGASHDFLVISTFISSFPPKVSPLINPPTHPPAPPHSPPPPVAVLDRKDSWVTIHLGLVDVRRYP